MNHVHADKCFVFSKSLVLLLLVLGLAALSPAAIAQYGNPLTESGFKPFGSFDGTNIDSVNLLNFELNLHIPLGPSYSQRGKMFPAGYHVAYEPNAITENDALYDCNAFEGGCAYENCQDCNIDVAMGSSVSGGLVIASDSGFDISGGVILTPDGGMHETARFSSLGGRMTLDTSGFYDTDPLGGEVSSYTTMNGDGVSRVENNGQQYYTDMNGNTATNLGEYGFTTDTIGRTLLDVASLNESPDPSYPEYPNPRSGTGWTMTTDYTGCTGPFTTVYAVIVSLPSINNSTAQYKICYADFSVSSSYYYVYDYTANGALPYGQWSLTPTGRLYRERYLNPILCERAGGCTLVA